MSLSIKFSNGDSRGMESPGACIKRERELRGFSIHDVHEATRIPVKRLIDLEADNYEALPQEAFVKGYIKAACKFMGLDETDLLLRYELFMKDNAPAPEASAEAAAPGNAPERSIPLSSKQVAGLLLGLGLLIIIVFYFLGRGGPDDDIIKAASRSAPAAGVDVRESQPASGQASSPLREGPLAVNAGEQGEKEATPPGHVLNVIATDELWVQLSIDNKTPIEVLFKKGETRQWLMKKGVSLVIGNAGGAAIVFDGEPVKMIEKPGRVIRMKLPRQE